MTRVASSIQSKPQTQVWIWLLLLGFVWLQLLGTAHRYLHSASSGGVVVQSAALSGLLDHSQSAASDGTACQLFDLACSGTALNTWLPVLLANNLPHQQIQVGSSEACFFSFCAFEARGPPTLI
jgi:hypothetical protein